ncbi:hypothetical protein EI94DRAFT_1730414 [Lactarius quietus]|nr:hypothetical protein EI94DRAFT_1730414 [Lactarius quietus]
MVRVRVYTTPFAHSLWGGAVLVHNAPRESPRKLEWVRRCHATVCAEKNHGRPGEEERDVTRMGGPVPFALPSSREHSVHGMRAIPPVRRVSPPVCARKREAPLSLDSPHYAKSHPLLTHFHFYAQGGGPGGIQCRLSIRTTPLPHAHSLSFLPPAGEQEGLQTPLVPSISAPLPLSGLRHHSPHVPTL